MFFQFFTLFSCFAHGTSYLNFRFRNKIVLITPVIFPTGYEGDRAMGGSESSAFVPAEIEARVLTAFISSSPAGFLMLDHNLQSLEVSPRWTTDWEISRNEVLGKHLYETYSALPGHIISAHRRGLAGETISAFDDRFRMQGEDYHCAWQVRPWGNPGDGTGGIIIYAENLAAPKHSAAGNRSDRRHSLRFPAHMRNDSPELSWARDGRLAAQDLLSSYREIACTCPPGHYDEHRAHQLDCRAHPSVPVIARAEQGIRQLVRLEQELNKNQGD
jgi:hypothetical protein